MRDWCVSGACLRSYVSGAVGNSDPAMSRGWIGPRAEAGLYFCLGNASELSPQFVAAVTAQSWALINGTYVIDRTWIAQVDYGVVQTGSLRTSQQDGAPRRVDNVLNTGVILDEDHMVCDVASSSLDYGDDQVAAVPTDAQCEAREFLVNWSSPFDERDVEISERGEPIDTLGRYFLERHGRTEYELKKWKNSIRSIVASSLEGREAGGKITDQIRSFRFENRFNPEALAFLENALKTLDLTSHDVVPVDDVWPLMQCPLIVAYLDDLSELCRRSILPREPPGDHREVIAEILAGLLSRYFAKVSSKLPHCMILDIVCLGEFME